MIKSGRLDGQVKSVHASPGSSRASRALSPLSDNSDEDFQPKKQGFPVRRQVLTERVEGNVANNCPFCDKVLKTLKILKKHKSLCVKNPNAERRLTSCEACGLCFTRKESLLKHMKGRCSKAQGKQEPSRHFCLFGACSARFYHKSDLISHLKISHAAKILSPQIHHFADWTGFLSWKDEEEQKNMSYFSEQYGEKKGRSYFYCQQDGPRKAKVSCVQPSVNFRCEDEDGREGVNKSSSKAKNRKNCCNLKGRMKTGFTCIAMMKVQRLETSVRVEYFPSHNHELLPADLKHQPLTNATNSYINQLLKIGASPRKIIKTLQGDRFCRTNRSSNQTLTRNDFIKIKSLRERRRKMACSERLADDDASAVHMLVQLLQQEEYAPVLIYKPFGQEMLYGPDSAKNSLDQDVFMLGIQTKEQAEMMKMASETILIVDATHGMDQYGSQLLNVMGVDELNRGYPLAHCITNKMDEFNLKFFFEAIKLRNPELNVNCVITDDDPALINSMNSGFVELLRHILCDWHFKRTLQRELHSKVKNNTGLEDEMFKELCVIIDCPIESEFNQTLQNFISKHQTDQQTKAFVEYFETYCTPKKWKWAKCFRRFPHGNVDTTMFVEAFHNILKTVYLKRKPNKRIDSLLSLLQVEEDYYARRQTTITTVAPREQYMIEISERHRRGVNIDRSHVQQYDENGSKYWKVQSQSDPDLEYKVFRISFECTRRTMCYFQCNSSDCHENLCAHMYMCTCPDDFVLCKHIHRVHSAFGERSSINKEIPKDVEFYSKPQDDMAHEAVPSKEDARAYQRQEKEEQEIKMLLFELSELATKDAVKKFLYPHIKGVLKGTVAQCHAAVEEDNGEDTVEVQPMKPTVQISSREKLKCQLRPFERKNKSKKELKRNLSRAPKLQEKIEIKRKLLTFSKSEGPSTSESNNKYRECQMLTGMEAVGTNLNPDVPFCVEVQSSPILSDGKPSVKPKIQFVSRPIFVPGKPSSKIFDKQTPIV